MMTRALYPNFLEDPRQYEQAEESWRRHWRDLVRRAGEPDLWETPWGNTTFADGTPCRDGNPIFSAVCRSRRLGIQVIQLEPSEHPRELSCWIDTFARGEPEEIQVLAISCVLTNHTQLDAVDLMNQWITCEEVQFSWQGDDPTSPRVPRLEHGRDRVRLAG
jgi:hypothetical protein